MKNLINSDLARAGFALTSGFGLTLSLFMATTLTSTSQITTMERRPLLIVELSRWQPKIETIKAKATPKRLPPPVTPQSPTNINPNQLPPKVTATPTPQPKENTLRAYDLINHSKDWVRQQDMEQLFPSGPGMINNLPPDSRTLAPVQQTSIMEAYRLPHGNTMVKTITLFGNEQCFEVPQQNALNTLHELASSVWMLTRCP